VISDRAPRPADLQARRLAGPVGRLPDGTAHYVPVGRVLADGDRVCCHLCGRWFLSVASHLPVPRLEQGGLHRGVRPAAAQSAQR